MRVAIDIDDAGGIARGGTHYTNRLLARFSKMAPEHEFLLFGFAYHDPGKLLRQFPLPPGRFSYAVKRWPQSVVRRLEEAGVPVVTGYLGLRGVDVHHAWVGHAGSGERVALTVPDITQVTRPEWNTPERLRFWHSRQRPAILKAKRVMTFCRASRDDMMRELGLPGERIHIVPLGADPAAFHPITDVAALAAVRAKFALPERFILMVGPIDPVCNFAGVIDALKDWPGEKPRFVVAGPVDDYVRGQQRRAEEAGVGGLFTWAGYVPHSELPLLYNLATAFLHPSILPGTEMPPYEAMACGTPVVTSLDEVIEDAGRLIDARSPASIGEALKAVWESQSLREALRAKGLARAKDYTWESTARETLKVYNEIVGS